MKKAINTLVWLLLAVAVIVCLVQFTKLNDQAAELTNVKQAYQERVQAARDSIAEISRENAFLIDQVVGQKGNIENLHRRIAAIIQAGQDADQAIALLPPGEVVQVFDSLTGEFPESKLLEADSDLVVAHTERVREANRLMTSINFISEQSRVKSLLIASQDTIINNLEAVNLNSGIHIQQLERIIELKDSQLQEYEKIIADCERRRKKDRYILGGVAILALFGLVF